MKNKHKKDWTILIYADGNNELEPEMWAAKKNAEKLGSNNNINVIMQLARENSHLVKIMRPSYIIDNDEEWNGVRRFYIKKGESSLIQDLGNINMADPHSLYNFILWGMEAYPANHFMLVLSGHGFSFVAAMTDLSQDVPYVMGISQMCKTINLAQKNTRVNIDILILDMCYMNTIEVLYELGKDKLYSVKNVLTYVKDGPLEGLPYNKLINSIAKNHNENDLSLVLKYIMDEINMNLVSIKINHGKLKKVKQIINSLAYSYLKTSFYKNIPPYNLIYSIDPTTPWYNYVLSYQKYLRGLIIYSNNKSINNDIDIITNKMILSNSKLDHYILSYYYLGFCKNNYWLNILTDNTVDINISINEIKQSITLEPTIIPPIGIPRNIKIMNPFLDKGDILSITQSLFSYKHWDESLILNEISKQDNNLKIFTKVHKKK